jgi:hypothetical protein
MLVTKFSCWTKCFLCCFLFWISDVGARALAAETMPPLPEDNLVVNPWFRTGNKPSLEGWLRIPADQGWGASQKEGNPTPDKVAGTAARVSTGRTVEERGQNTKPKQDVYLYQIIPADPAKRTLKFDMYWVTHTLNPGEVNILGANSKDGPWTQLWRPFYQVHTKMVIPASRRGNDLWPHYSDLTDLVKTNLSIGFPYYKLEVHANLPDASGGFKITGIYFAATDAAGEKGTAGKSGQANP